jgi:hypothetical protein
MNKWRLYEAFKKTLQNLSADEYEKAIKEYCKKHGI